MLSKEVINVIKRLIKTKYGERCDEEEIVKSLNRIILEKIDPALIKAYRSKSDRKPKKAILPEDKIVEILLGETQPEIAAI